MQNHQHALIVVLSYIIGFVTAFIMFGLQGGDQVKKQNYSNQFPPEEVGMRGRSAPPRLEETEEGLFVHNNGYARIISALTRAEVAEAGYHVAISSSVVSPNAKYVSYCAQMDVASEECQYFVYSVAEDKTYMVKYEDESMLVTANDDAANVIWTSDSKLSADGMMASAESMWVLR